MPPTQDCPEQPKNGETIVRLLHAACQKLGGEEALADLLGVPRGAIHIWLTGRGHPPDDILLKCVDFLEAGRI